MPRNLLSALNYVPDGKAPKNPFDIGNFETFHQKGGQFNLVGFRKTVPNSDYRMSVDAFTRTQLCNTANFAHMKENYYFVHVPLALVSQNMYQMLVQRKQPYSAQNFGIAKAPFFTLKTVLKRCLEIAHLNLSLSENQKFKDVHGFNIGLGAFKLLDMLGYGCYLDIVESTFKEENALTVDQAKAIFDNIPYKPNALLIGAYQMVWYYFFRNQIYDNNVNPRCFNFDDITVTTFGNEPLSDYDILAIRDVDDFIIECLQMRYVPYKNDLFMGAMPGTQYGPVSTVSLNVTFADLTAAFVGNAVTPSGSFTGTSSTITSTGELTDLRTGSDEGTHYLNINGTDNPPTGNVTGSVGASVVPRDTTPASYSNLPSNVLVTWADVGNGVEPCVQLQNGSLVTYIDYLENPSAYDSALVRDKHYHSLPNKNVSVSSSFTPNGSISIDSITPSGTVTLTGTPTASTLFDVLSLVEAQAIQKWRQKSMLAGNKTADQFRAHHGEVPRHLIDHIPDFIGSVDNPIQITEITSQADTAVADDESNLGSIRGRGYGASDNKTFSFHSDDYGYLMLFHAIVPENTYSSFGLDPSHTKIEYTDFFQQEYMNIGLEALPNYVLNITDALSANPTFPDSSHTEGRDDFPSSGVSIRGYVPRYYDYKTMVSKVHGMFNPSRLTLFDVAAVDIFGYDDMQSFVMPRKDLVVDLNNTSITFPWLVWTLSKLYINPSIFDSIFAENADSHELTDEFFSHVRFNCDSLLPMSVLGLPQF